MTEIQKKKIKEERILKLKKIGFWSLNIFCYICSFLFIILLIISLSTPKSSSKSSPKNVINQIQYRLDSSESESVSESEEVIYPIYDDVNHTITLSAYILNNYDFPNLTEYIQNNTTGYNTWSISYNSNNYSYGNRSQNVSATPDYFLVFNYSHDTYYTNRIRINYSNTPNRFSYYYENSNNVTGFSEFESDIIFTPYNGYSNIKTAIQTDVLANQEQDVDVNYDIFGSITQTISNFLNTLNEGVESVIDLFWDSDNNQLTTLGGLTTIVIGVAVAFFLFRLLIGLIRLRG